MNSIVGYEVADVRSGTLTKPCLAGRSSSNARRKSALLCAPRLLSDVRDTGWPQGKAGIPKRRRRLLLGGVQKLEAASPKSESGITSEARA
jgi:hypothetical protein